MTGEALIEGYASLFGEEDLCGDIVRAGAFARSLMGDGQSAPMLLQHQGGRVVGRWVRMVEDGKGLYVRGLVDENSPAGAGALRLIRRGMLSGLSIGFIARNWSPRPGRGRDLKTLELREISLVTSPMAPKARFMVLSDAVKAVA